MTLTILREDGSRVGSLKLAAGYSMVGVGGSRILVAGPDGKVRAIEKDLTVRTVGSMLPGGNSIMGAIASPDGSLGMGHQ